VDLAQLDHVTARCTNSVLDSQWDSVRCVVEVYSVLAQCFACLLQSAEKIN